MYDNNFIWGLDRAIDLISFCLIGNKIPRTIHIIAVKKLTYDEFHYFPLPGIFENDCDNFVDDAVYYRCTEVNIRWLVINMSLQI